jgi:hypothetical protein
VPVFESILLVLVVKIVLQHNPAKADIRRTNCRVYEILILENPRTKLDLLAVTRTYLTRQAAPPNF